MKKFLNYLMVALLLCSSVSYSQSIKVPAPSPLQTVTQAFGLGEIKIEYSRPGVKDRVIFGDLLPYGKIWRTGANQSTKITFTEDVNVSGNSVAAGTYALYTIPGQTEWDIMFYKDTKLGGDVANYKKEDELFRFKAKPVQMNDKMETFLININNITSTACNIELMWDKTKVGFLVTTDIDSKVMKQIEKELAPGDRKPYHNAAVYYYDTNKDMNKALEWENKAIENNPDAYWMIHQKAKIQMKLKDYKGAITTAELSKQKAIADKNDDYVKLNDKLIADAKMQMGQK